MSKKKKETKRQENTRLRNEAVAKRFKRLYEVERTRYDDCVEKLAKEFFITPCTVGRIIAAS